VKREPTERVDKLLVQRGLADSRTKAQALVMAGIVLVNEQRVDKPSAAIPVDAEIRIKGGDDPAARYVGRGGLKLEAALREFQISVQGLSCLDVGASTGGFTDCLLQHGAAQVMALDVGHNQIDWRLRNDPRVEVREGVNARYLSRADFQADFDLAVMDVSFISATKIFPALVPLIKPGGHLILLIKPQFEVGRADVGKGGIVRDRSKRAQVIQAVSKAAEQLGLIVQQVIESPLRGADGNIEFLALYENGSTTDTKI